jgi:triosephosphate isomerase
VSPKRPDPDRPLLVAGNWKMHENHYEALRLVHEMGALVRPGGIPPGREASVHPPFTSLRTVQTAIETDHLPFVLGAQTCSGADRGAYTGEVSAEMLAKLNVRYVLAGHSERRQLCGETDEIVRAKVDAILRNGLTPIVCVGESLAERQEGLAPERVAAQVRAAFGGRSAGVAASCVVAYEPLWAIGTGETAKPEDAEQMGALIRRELEALAPGAGLARILYGGSVTDDNAGELLEQRNVDGLLVGGASLDAQRFVAIVRAALS